MLHPSALGNITRIGNIFNEVPNAVQRFEEQLTETEKQLKVEKAEVNRPFEHEERLAGLIARQNQLNMELEFKDLSGEKDARNYLAAHAEDNYAKLEAFAPEIVSGEMDYMRFTADGYSNLYMKRIGYDILKIAYYFESDCNRLRDPEVMLRLNASDRTLTPVSCEQDTIAVKQKVSDGPGGMDERLLSDLDVFMNDWLTDISQQGYELSPERQDEAEMPFFVARNDGQEQFYEDNEYENDGAAG